MQDYSWKTVPFVPFYHFLGINDTGILFMCYWYYYFPYDDAIEACLKPAGQADVKRIHLRRPLSSAGGGLLVENRIES